MRHWRSPDNEDFEFIELRNVGAGALDLRDLRFTKGIDFVDGEILTLPAGAYVLVVKNLAAFQGRYGTGLPVAGVYSGNLSNGGELLKLSLGAGTAVHEFSYDDADPWPTEADMAGASLILVKPEERPDHALAENWTAGLPASQSGGGVGSGRRTLWGVDDHHRQRECRGFSR